MTTEKRWIYHDGELKERNETAEISAMRFDADVMAGMPLPAFAFPGGYPLCYLDAENNVLCADCASVSDEFNEPTVACGTHLEGPPIHCDDCEFGIESAYGDPDEEGKVAV